MFHSLKRFWVVLAVLLGGARAMFGFALLGPVNESYQTQAIGYNLSPVSGFGDAFPVDVGAPKNIGQGYRWNTPTNYYAFDPSFAKFFGTKGMAAVDQAFAMFNSLSNVSSYSPTLSEWPLKSTRVNFNAEALGLLDVKSVTMQFMIEELGLASPDRWTWALHHRDPIVNEPCPAFDYFVIQRNYDPVTQTYSSYVNGQLLGYTIVEFCGLNPNTFAPLLADAEEYTTDPKQALTAVASGGLELSTGAFFTGFTRDDIGGLRYLYGATNVYQEPVTTNSALLATNSNPVALTTSNLVIFEMQALTNDAATLMMLYPNLIITATTNFLTTTVTTNFSFVITRPIGAPANELQLQLVATLTTNVVTNFIHTFANLVVLHTGGPALEYLLGTQVTQPPGSIPGQSNNFQTNLALLGTVVTPFTNGDFYILRSDQCAPDVIDRTVLAQVSGVTNFLPISVGTVGNIPQFIVGEEVFIFTNFTYSAREVLCDSNTVAAHQGIEHVTFVRRDFFDGLTGTTWNPITNYYNLIAVTNVPIVQTYRRIVTAPDIIFEATDQLSGPDQLPAVNALFRSVPNFNSVYTSINPNNRFIIQPGPGIISPSVTNVVITFNDVGPFFENSGPYFKNIGGNIGIAGDPDTNSSFGFQFGSFDGTTNAPVIYPDTRSLADLEASLYFQITTPSPLPTGKAGTVYNANGVGPGTNGVQLVATGATPFLPPQSAYIWSTNIPGLPSGLTISAKGIISGIPTKSGTNQFTVQITDAGQRTTTKLFEIGITP